MLQVAPTKIRANGEDTGDRTGGPSQASRAKSSDSSRSSLAVASRCCVLSVGPHVAFMIYDWPHPPNLKPEVQRETVSQVHPDNKSPSRDTTPGLSASEHQTGLPCLSFQQKDWLPPLLSSLRMPIPGLSISYASPCCKFIIP